MKKKFVIFTLLSCLLFGQINMPVMAADVNTETGASGHAGGGGGYHAGSAGHVHQYKGSPSYVNGVLVYSESYGCYKDGSYTVDGTGTCNITVSLEIYTVSAGWTGRCASCGHSYDGEGGYNGYRYGYAHVRHSYSGHSDSDVFLIICPACGNRTNGEPFPSNGTDTYSTKIPRYGVNCGITQTSGKGSKSYFSAVGALTKGLTNTPQSYRTGNGVFSLIAKNVNVASGQANTSYINNIKMPDKVAPDNVTLSYLQEINKTTVNWDEPESNGTEYEFKVQVYKVDLNAEGGLVLEQDSEYM